MLKVAIIGFGRWGPNLARNFQNSRNFEIKCVVDKSNKNLSKAKSIYPLADYFNDYKKIISNKIDLVIIATPTKFHFEIASYFLKKNNVLIEKPLSTALKQVKILEYIAKKNSQFLFVDYPFIFSKSINYLKKIIHNNKFGKLIEIESYREQAPIRDDTNVVWDLSVHDISILMYLINKKPFKISSNKLRTSHSKNYDTVYVNIEYKNNLNIFIKNSWISPVKIRLIKLKFEKCFIICDENEPLYKIKIFKKRNNSDLNYNVQIPEIDISEPLFNLTEYIFKSIKNKKNQIFKDNFNIKITKILEQI